MADFIFDLALIGNCGLAFSSSDESSESSLEDSSFFAVDFVGGIGVAFFNTGLTGLSSSLSLLSSLEDSF